MTDSEQEPSAGRGEHDSITRQSGVKALLRNGEGRFLACRRIKPFLDGTVAWDVPGGRRNDGETSAAALWREASEEIGVGDEDPGKLFGAVPEEPLATQDIFVLGGDGDNDLHVKRRTYLVEYNGPDALVLGDEHSEYGWFTLEELAQLPLDPYLKVVVNSLLPEQNPRESESLASHETPNSLSS